MVKQIIWSPLAKEGLKNLLLASQQQSGGMEQGKALYQSLQNTLHRITQNPFLGQATEVDNLRYISPHPDFTLFYRHSLLKIEVLVIWDNHRKAGRVRWIEGVRGVRRS